MGLNPEDILFEPIAVETDPPKTPDPVVSEPPKSELPDMGDYCSRLSDYDAGFTGRLGHPGHQSITGENLMEAARLLFRENYSDLPVHDIQEQRPALPREAEQLYLALKKQWHLEKEWIEQHGYGSNCMEARQQAVQNIKTFASCGVITRDALLMQKASDIRKNIIDHRSVAQLQMLKTQRKRPNPATTEVISDQEAEDRVKVLLEKGLIR